MEQKNNGAHCRRISLLAGVGGLLGAVCLLYLFGGGLARKHGWEYRFWAECLGQLLLFLGIPLWGICGAAKQMCRKGIRKTMAALATSFLLVLFLAWSGLFTLLLLFSTPSEQELDGHYLAVNMELGLAEARWEIYEAKGLFFRQHCDRLEAEWQYLEEKYGESFERKKVTEEMRTCYQGGIYGGNEAWFSASHPDVPVYVRIGAQGLYDNYISMAVLRSFYRTCEEKEISTEYIQVGQILYFLLRENELPRFCENARILMEEAEQDPLFQKWKGLLMYQVVLDGEKYYGNGFSFGGFGLSGGAEAGYYLKEGVLEEQAEQSIRKAKETAAEWAARRAEAESRQETGRQAWADRGTEEYREATGE